MIESKKVRILFIIEGIVLLILTIMSILNRNKIGVFASFAWIGLVQPIVYGAVGMTVWIYLIVRLKNNIKINKQE